MMNMKSFTYQGHEIQLTTIRFTFGEEATAQDGILMHDANDAFSDGDAIFGNGWNLDMINDESDLESMLTSGDGTTYFSKNADGTYTINA